MKLTKKQIAALNRIIKRDKHCKNKGFHSSLDRFAVSDGYVTVIFNEKPDCLPEGERIDLYEKFKREQLDNHNYYIADGYLIENTDIIAECKQAIQEWGQTPISRSGGEGYIPVPIVRFCTEDNKENKISASYNAKLVLDAMESVGTGALAYLAKSKNQPATYLWIKRKNWMDGEDDYDAFVMPFRVNR